MIHTLEIKGYIELADHESLSTTPYLDSGGVKTVGIGSTQSDIPDLKNWAWDKEITIQYAFDAFKVGLNSYIYAVNTAMDGVVLNDHQFSALVAFTYNVGINGATKSTLFREIKTNNSNNRIRDAFMMWVYDNGKKVQGLINRRSKEADLYCNGLYSNQTGKILHFPVSIKTHSPLYNKGVLINCYDYL